MSFYDEIIADDIFSYSYALSYTLSDRSYLIHGIQKDIKREVSILLGDIGWLMSDNGLDDLVIDIRLRQERYEGMSRIVRLMFRQYFLKVCNVCCMRRNFGDREEALDLI